MVGRALRARRYCARGSGVQTNSRPTKSNQFCDLWFLTVESGSIILRKCSPISSACFLVPRGKEAIVGHVRRFTYNYNPAAKKSESNKKRFPGRRRIFKWLILTSFSQGITELILHLKSFSQARSRVSMVHEVTTMSLLHSCNTLAILRYKKGE